MVQLVQQWLSTNGWSTNPVAIQSMKLDVSAWIPKNWALMPVKEWTVQREGDQAKMFPFSMS